ncbi:MAG: response regulator [Pseudomonadales bacterium]|nr:response regulator [Pseudomonadales bacterium]
MNIDIIDDEPSLRELYKTMIEASGFSVNCYASAEDYIFYTKSKNYTPPNIALVTDVRMPGKSGYELIDEIKKSNPEQKFVVITGTPRDCYSKDTRACFYLQKPLSSKKLLAVITLLSSCAIAGNTNLASECKQLNDLDSFDIHDWECPHKK